MKKQTPQLEAKTIFVFKAKKATAVIPSTDTGITTSVLTTR